eukprot:1157646-Pelagomonas_calceolata.AAC.9
MYLGANTIGRLGSEPAYWHPPPKKRPKQWHANMLQKVLWLTSTASYSVAFEQKCRVHIFLSIYMLTLLKFPWYKNSSFSHTVWPTWFEVQFCWRPLVMKGMNA